MSLSLPSVFDLPEAPADFRPRPAAGLRVAIHGVTKTFPVDRRGQTLFQLARRLASRADPVDRFTALRDVTFDVHSGDRIGVIGDNGAGKTTLLKTVAGLYAPDSGSVEVYGSLTLLSGLGIGMIEDLTVAENIALYGAIYGVDPRTLRDVQNDILEWAELDEFANAKLKRLSTGMKARLAFSTTRHVNADVHLLDEALTAGDRRFQLKCEQVFDDYVVQGKTFVVATHDHAFVRRVCTHAVWLHKSRQVAFGDPDDLVARYLDSANRPLM